MNSKIKLTLGYFWAIVTSITLLAAVQSLLVGSPSGAAIIGYVMVFGYFILRWNFVARKITVKNKWLSVFLRIFVIICSLVIFSGVSSFHGGSEEGKIFASVIALAMAMETGMQFTRLSIQTSGQ
jgi:apolipoprotein N-acyltransferase